MRMFAPVIGAAYTMTTKREAHWSEQTKAQNTEKGMYVGLKQPRGDGERYVIPARVAGKETKINLAEIILSSPVALVLDNLFRWIKITLLVVGQKQSLLQFSGI